jgi:hypothetical protein
MTEAPSAVGAHSRPRQRPVPVQAYARAAGLLFLVTMVCGFFGELYAPSTIVVGNDAAATARNVIAMNSLFRLGFASYLVEALCDVTLALIFYVLLRPVRRNLSLLAAFFGLISTALFAMAELFYFAPTLILSGAEYLKVFSPDQLNALALLSLKVYARAGGLFMVFYGVAGIIRGYLIYQSGYLPRTLGVLLTIAGLGFIIKNFTLVLAPSYSSDLLLAPMFVAGLALTSWMLVRGVDVRKWEARAAA